MTEEGTDVITTPDRRWFTVLLIATQLVVGLVGGWFTGIGVFLGGLIAVSVLGVRPTTGDVLCACGMIVWASTTCILAVVVHRFRPNWLVPLFYAFAFGTTIVTLFAILVAIPFGASMRDFD